MNLFSVSDGSGELLPYARHLLDALAFWPGDERSVRQVRAVLESEYEVWLHSRTEYAPSRLASTILNSAAKRSQQVWVTGLVGLALLGLHTQGKRTSLEAAYRLVEAHTAQRNLFTFVFFDSKNGEFIEKEVRVQSDPTSIRKIFKEYRCAAQICSARVVANEYLEPLAPFETAREADRCYLMTALAFQHFFEKQLKRQSWEMRLVSAPPGLNNDAVAFLPTNTQMEALFGDALG